MRASGQDMFEPDNSYEYATEIDVAEVQDHTLHIAGDADWAKFTAVDGFEYNITAEQSGTNVHVNLEILREEFDLSLTPLTNLSYTASPGPGTGNFARIVMDVDLDSSPGVHYLRVSGADTNFWGIDSDYTLVIELGGQNEFPRYIYVSAFDRLASDSPPPGAYALVDGGNQRFFGGNTTIVYTNLTFGNHLFQVVAPGYLPEESPDQPNQVTNPNSKLYGNPRNKFVTLDQWQSIAFQFVPIIYATGRVHDAWTGEPVGGAKVEFVAAGGAISGLVYDGYPGFASYKTPWFTTASGGFPPNILLPAVPYNLRLSKAGFVTNIQVGAVPVLSPGSSHTVGSRKITPVDTNANGMSDAWEATHFGPGADVSPVADADGDGQSNQDEYRAGFSPTNASSVFHANAVRADPGLTLQWSVAPYRRYWVAAQQGFPTGVWNQVAGPWTAAVGQTSMGWTNPAPVDAAATLRLESGIP